MLFQSDVLRLVHHPGIPTTIVADPQHRGGVGGKGYITMVNYMKSYSCLFMLSIVQVAYHGDTRNELET